MSAQEIKCSVESCKYNEEASMCSLPCIAVGNEPMGMEAKAKQDTECNSFEPMQ